MHVHCVSKEVPTFKLSVTLSDLNRFLKFLHCWKACEIITHLTLGMLLHYLGKSKIQFFANIQQICKNANKLHFQCTDFNSSKCVSVYAECIYVFLLQSCPCRWMPCWLLINTAVTSAVTNFRCHRLIEKNKQVKEHSDRKFYLQSIWWKTRYLRHPKYKNLWMNNKVRSDKNAICLHFSVSTEYLQKISIFNFPR